MIIQIKLMVKKGIVLPLHYKSLLQGYLYHHFPQEMGTYLHDEGFQSGSRTFKLFVFSDLQQKARKVGSFLHFDEEITFLVSSPMPEILEGLGEEILRNPGRLGQNLIQEALVYQATPDLLASEVQVVLVSPLVVYHTVVQEDGRKYTDFLTPHHPDFPTLVKNNLLRKYESLFGDVPTNLSFSIEALGPFEVRGQYFRNFYLKGTYGRFLLKGDPRLLSLALTTGLGSKNAQGFGMAIHAT